MELRFLFSAQCLMMLYICTKVRESIPKGFKDNLRTISGVGVLVLCTLFDDGLSIIKFRENISKGFRVIERT